MSVIRSVATAVPDLDIDIRRADDARGIAIVLPAFLDSKDDSVVAELSNQIPGTGLDTITFDPRGTWSSTDKGTIDDIAPSRQLADIRALINAHAVDRGRVVLIGHCYGANLSILAAGADSRITDVVALMPTRCLIWNKDYESRFDTWKFEGSRSFFRKDARLGSREFAVPHSVVCDAAAHSLGEVLPGLHQRVLFIGGTKDQVVGSKAVRRMHDECTAADSTLNILPVKHDFRDVPQQHDLVNRSVVGWLGG